MSEGESFLVIFATRGANVTTNTNNVNVTFNVQWSSFLPTKYNRFHCQIVFKSENYINATLLAAPATPLSVNGYINMSLGRMNVYAGTTMSNNIAVIYPVVAAVYSSTTNNYSQSYMSSTNNDNNDFSSAYPSGQQVTITLNSFAGAALANMPHWNMYLSMVGIEDP